MAYQQQPKALTMAGFVRKGVLPAPIVAGDVRYAHLPGKGYVVLCPLLQEGVLLGLLVMTQQVDARFEPIVYGTSQRLWEIAPALDGLIARLGARQLCFSPWRVLAWRYLPAWLWPIVEHVRLGSPAVATTLDEQDGLAGDWPY